jgi:hypothetical protein
MALHDMEPLMPPNAAPTSLPRRSFRARYDDLEQRRRALLERLAALGDKARAHPSHARALALLNQSFRKAKLAQRAAVLQAASFLIDVIDKAVALL